MERDKTLKGFLEKKETPYPSDSLDDRIMEIISRKGEKYSSNQKSLYLAWFFFVIGLISGIAVITLITDPEIIGSKLIIQILCSLVIIILFERLYKLTIESRN